MTSHPLPPVYPFSNLTILYSFNMGKPPKSTFIHPFFTPQNSPMDAFCRPSCHTLVFSFTRDLIASITLTHYLPTTFCSIPLDTSNTNPKYIRDMLQLPPIYIDLTYHSSHPNTIPFLLSALTFNYFVYIHKLNIAPSLSDILLISPQ